jgi:uncharacterized protein (DUF302 family)
MFHYTVKTNQTIKEAIETLEQNLKEESFGVLWKFDIKDTLESKGFELNQPFHVLEVCNPKEAQRVLAKNKLAGYFLPCKIVVYEDAGNTYIGLPKPSALIQMADDEPLSAIAEDIEKRLISVLDQSVS